MCPSRDFNKHRQNKALEQLDVQTLKVDTAKVYHANAQLGASVTSPDAIVKTKIHEAVISQVRMDSV